MKLNRNNNLQSYTWCAWWETKNLNIYIKIFFKLNGFISCKEILAEVIKKSILFQNMIPTKHLQMHFNQVLKKLKMLLLQNFLQEKAKLFSRHYSCSWVNFTGTIYVCIIATSRGNVFILYARKDRCRSALDTFPARQKPSPEAPVYVLIYIHRYIRVYKRVYIHAENTEGAGERVVMETPQAQA